MAFDKTQRRLITGGRDGSVKIWNFHNGDCLRVMETPDNMEVGGFFNLAQMKIYKKTIYIARYTGGTLVSRISWNQAVHAGLLRACLWCTEFVKELFCVFLLEQLSGVGPLSLFALEFPGVSQGFPGFPRVSQGFPGFPRVFQGNTYCSRVLVFNR